jgi:hypothetical protein
MELVAAGLPILSRTENAHAAVVVIFLVSNMPRRTPIRTRLFRRSGLKQRSFGVIDGSTPGQLGLRVTRRATNPTSREANYV